MDLKYIGYLIFAVIIFYILIYVLLSVKKRNKMRVNLIPVLSKEVTSSNDYFEEIKERINPKLIPFLDKKAYRHSSFKEYELADFSKVESMYNTYIMYIDFQEDRSVIPFYLSEKEYKNIYIFIKELMYSINLRYESKINKATSEDTYFQICEFIMFHNISFDDIYFLPIKYTGDNEIEINELRDLSAISGFNNVMSVPNMFEFGSKKLTLTINEQKIKPDYKKCNENVIKFIETTKFTKTLANLDDDNYLVVYSKNENYLESLYVDFKIKLLILNSVEVGQYTDKTNLNDLKNIFNMNWLNEMSFNLPNPMEVTLSLFGDDELEIKIINKQDPTFIKISGDKRTLIRTGRV